MKIKHIISVEQTELDDLFDVVMKACLASYSTVDEQATAIAQSKEVFKVKLDMLVCQAFKLGKKVSKAKADTKDTEMYSAEAETPTTV